MLNLEGENNSQIGRAFVTTCRQWEALERRKGTGINIIDIDVSPAHVKHLPAINNRQQVAVRLEQIARAVDDSRADGQYLSAKVSALNVFRQDLDLADGLHEEERLPWNEYIEVVNGSAPIEVSQRPIKQQYELVQALFRDLNNGRYNLDPAGWKGFFNEQKLSPLEVEATFKEAEKKAKPVILDILGGSFYQKYRTKPEPEDKPHLNWITGGRAGFVLKINTHPRTQPSWFRGNPETLAIHEVGGHIMQASMLRKGIDRMQVNPGCGIMTVPGPEQWGAEGLAVTLPYLLQPLMDILTDYGRFALEYRLLRYMVEGNALIDLHKDNPPSKHELIQRLQYYLPHRSEVAIKTFFQEGSFDPVYKAYNRSYEDGSFYFWRIAEDLSEHDKEELIRTYYTQPMTPDQIKKWVWNKKSKAFLQAS